jgi:hypothetical protein
MTRKVLAFNGFRDVSRPFAPTAGVRCLREERLATAWAWEGTHGRTMRLLTLDA